VDSVDTPIGEDSGMTWLDTKNRRRSVVGLKHAQKPKQSRQSGICSPDGFAGVGPDAWGNCPVFDQ
jgi:hypothetical protein